MKKWKAKGHRGSWFAELDGESLPCVHKHWMVGLTHNDPQVKPGDPQSDQLVAAIVQARRVILTNDNPHVAERGTGFTRTGYVAEYGVDEIEFDSAGLRFRFVSRLRELA